LTVKARVTLLKLANSLPQSIRAPNKVTLQRHFTYHFICFSAILFEQRLLVNDSGINLAIKLFLRVFFGLLSSHTLLYFNDQSVHLPHVLLTLRQLLLDLAYLLPDPHKLVSLLVFQFASLPIAFDQFLVGLFHLGFKLV
jgi:hypothetical protein